MQLENVQSKEQIINDFFVWLFNDKDSLVESVDFKKEIDLTMCHYYYDDNIYYPSCISKLFDTNAFKRLGRISQLSIMIDQFPNAYHNRLEHCKGTYNKKLEEFIYKYQDESWRDSIETNHQKIYVLADLIKMLGHDLGHPILSHAMEDAIFSKHGAHEIIGKRIMTELPEIQDILQSINPRLPNALKEVYEKNILNFEDHDDSNYDVDRRDFLERDSLYFGSYAHFPFQYYKTISTNDGSHDIYPYSSLKYIEDLLYKREFNYKNGYTSLYTLLRESVLPLFIEAFLSCESEYGKDLKEFLMHLRETDIDDIDLNEFIEWDEIKYYDSLLDVAQFHENQYIRDLAAMLFPNTNAFLTLLYSHLDIKNSKDYSPFDKSFLQKVQELIKNNNSIFYTKLINSEFADKNILVALDDLHYSGANNLSFTIIPYKITKAIYFESPQGEIELSKHPESTRPWGSDITRVSKNFAITPYLKFKGFSDEQIRQKFKPFVPLYHYKSKGQMPHPEVNMQPLQVGRNIEDEFLEL